MDKSLHSKKDGKVFQMLDGFTNEPIPFNQAKHNYTKKDYNRLEVGQSIKFNPMFGNENPVSSILLRTV